MPSPASRAIHNQSQPLVLHVTPAEATAIRERAEQADRSISSELRRALRSYLTENPVAASTGRGSETRVAARHVQR